MADSSLVPPLYNDHDATEINNDLENMIENMELISGGAPLLSILYYPSLFVLVQLVEDSRQSVVSICSATHLDGL